MNTIWFWRFTELHYSQTRMTTAFGQVLVLEIYRITLLSNVCSDSIISTKVLEIYRITLLSNSRDIPVSPVDVLEIYRITLLSNGRGTMETYPEVLEIYRITLLSNPKYAFGVQKQLGLPPGVIL